MSDYSHGRLTPGTMRVTIGGLQSNFHCVGVDGTNKAVALTGLVGGDASHTDDEISAADARRLAACWNACEGLPTNRLESESIENTLSCSTGEVFEIRHQLNISKIERGNLESRIAAQREKIGRLHARVGTLLDKEQASSHSFAKVSARFLEMQTELSAARALLIDVLAVDDEVISELALLGTPADIECDAYRMTERIRALLNPVDKRADNITREEVVNAAVHAIGLAAGAGLVLTVWQEPCKPLAMGNYTTRFDVRTARERA